MPSIDRFQWVDLFLALLLPISLLLTACINLGPEYERPEQSFDEPPAYQHAQEQPMETPWPEDRWWLAFGDPDIDELVAGVLENNYDIRIAAARIMELESQFTRTRAARFPTLDLRAKAEKSSVYATNPITGSRSRVESEAFGLSLPATFELDIFGRLAKAAEAAQWDLLQVKENRNAIAQTVVAEAISAYLRMEAFERRIQILNESIASYENSLALVDARYRKGLTSVLDVRQARRLLARSETLMPGLHQELGLTQQRIAFLLGRYPRTSPPRQQPEEYFQRLAPVASGLPSELLNRRPDIRASEAGLKALNARVGAAYANRFPRISLTGSFGYASQELGDLFRPESELWNLALGLTQPLFDAGRLKSEQSIAEARFEQGIINYSKTVLNAFAEVEGALLTRKEQLRRRERVIKFLEEARATQKVAQMRYDRGLVDYLTVLDAQQVTLTAEEDLVQVDQAIFQNRVTLHRALGGGWGEEKKS